MSLATECAEPRVCGECGGEIPAGVKACPGCLLRLAILVAEPGEELGGAELMESVRERELRVGRVFGRYRLLAEAGRGGMGVVYRARQEGLDREVAVKLLVGGPYAAPEQAERLRLEALALGRLRHPGIVAVHDAGVAEGQPFLVMEWVEGGSLASRLVEGPIATGQLVGWMVGIGEAVEHAHAAGVWHRDLKPANILIDAEGRPRVTDFGLAKLADGPAGLTLSGMPLGTPGYLAPEQIDGRMGTLGPWTDVYALGAVMYHALTGRPVFVAAQAQETLRQALENDPAAPRLLNPAIPEALEWVCLKCLAREPGRRYRGVAALVEDLRRFRDGHPVHARPAGGWERWLRWCRRHPKAAAGIAGAIVATGVWSGTVTWLWQDAASAAERARQVAVRLRRERIEDLFDHGQGKRALAEWGRLLEADPSDHVAASRAVFAMAWRNPPVRVRSVEAHGGAVTALEVERGRDGRLLSASLDGTVRVWGGGGAMEPMFRIDCGAPVVGARWVVGGMGWVTGDREGRVRWWDGGDGRLLREWRMSGPVRRVESSLGSGGRVGVLAVGEGKEVRVCWEAGPDAGIGVALESEVETACFAPGGGRFAVGCRDGQVRVFDALTGRPAGPVLAHEQRVVDVLFDGEGRRLATASWDGRVRLWHPERGELVSEAPAFGSWATGVRVSPDGGEWLLGSADWRVVLWRPGESSAEGRGWRQDGPVVALEYSQDGMRVLSGSPEGQVRVREAGTGYERVLPMDAGGGGTLTAARFVAGGGMVVTGDDRGRLGWWDVRPRTPKAVVLGQAPLVQASWSGDAGRVVTVGRDRVARVWDAESGVQVFATPTNSQALAAAVLSGDGRRLLVAGRDGRAGLWDTATGSVRDLEPGHRRGVWRVVFSPGEERIATASWDGEARVWDAATGLPVGPAYPHSGPVSAVAFHPGGQRLATGTRTGEVRIWRPPLADPEAGGRWHGDEVTVVAFSPDGRWVLSGSLDRRVLLTSVGAGAATRELAHESGVMAAAFAPDGRTVATGGAGGVVRLWGVERGGSHGPWLVHGGVVNGVAFDTAGRRLATIASDGWVRLWDVESGLLLGRLEQQFSGLLTVGFDPGGTRLLVGSADDGAGIWPVPEMPMPVPPWFPRWIATLSGPGAGDREGLLADLEQEEGAAAWKDWGRRFLEPRADSAGLVGRGR